MPDHPVDPWEPLRSQLATEVGRVAERLRSMSLARLDGRLAPPEDGMPTWGTRAEAGRGIGSVLSDVATALEAAAAGDPQPASRAMPELGAFAAGDQAAVGGHDLLAAMDLVTPDTDVWFERQRPAADAVVSALRLLTDVRRRL